MWRRRRPARDAGTNLHLRPEQRCRAEKFLQAAAFTALAPYPQSEQHVIPLGDSIFDNGRYTGGGPAVVTWVRDRLPPGRKASLLAVDGATARNVLEQPERIPEDAPQLVLSAGGNDALMRQGLLDAPVRSSSETFSQLSGAALEF